VKSRGGLNWRWRGQHRGGATRGPARRGLLRRAVVPLPWMGLEAGSALTCVYSTRTLCALGRAVLHKKREKREILVPGSARWQWLDACRSPGHRLQAIRRVSPRPQLLAPDPVISRFPPDARSGHGLRSLREPCLFRRLAKNDPPLAGRCLACKQLLRKDFRHWLTPPRQLAARSTQQRNDALWHSRSPAPRQGSRACPRPQLLPPGPLAFSTRRAPTNAWRSSRLCANPSDPSPLASDSFHFISHDATSAL
jgi:hypothetical protein